MLELFSIHFYCRLPLCRRGRGRVISIIFNCNLFNFSVRRAATGGHLGVDVNGLEIYL